MVNGVTCYKAGPKLQVFLINAELSEYLTKT